MVSSVLLGRDFQLMDNAEAKAPGTPDNQRLSKEDVQTFANNKPVWAIPSAALSNYTWRAVLST